MRKHLKRLLANRVILTSLFALLAVTAGVQAIVNSSDVLRRGGPYTREYHTRYNNYVIFKASFSHLAEGKDLYVYHPEEHWDLFKYTPAFAVFFGLFAWLPDWIGLNLWNLVNALVLLAAVFYLPGPEGHRKGLALMACAIELLTSIQNEQSNGLMAGLLVFSFGLLERRRYLFAALCIVSSVFIKLFGIVGLVLFLFYPGKWKLGAYVALWTAILFLLPLFFVGPEQYGYLWQSYGKLLAGDFEGSQGYSVMGWLDSWFGLRPDKKIVILAGALLFIAPFLHIKRYGDPVFRTLALSSVLLWIVIFNHKAESPTFIIAVAGAALWFITRRATPFDLTLFSLMMLFTVLSPTDIFPRFLREQLVKPYSLKVFPCIMIWGKVVWDMAGWNKAVAVKAP